MSDAATAVAPATSFSLALLRGLARRGVTDVVVAPGSRSQALALAAAALHRAGELRLHVRTDERVAAFLALGLAVESQRLVPIVTTSGTAVAHLLPALLEARHSGVPLLALTADRPAELRGTGSNQTTLQAGLFGPAVARDWDEPAPTGAADEGERADALAAEVLAAAAPGTPRAAPVHLNLQLRAPLSSAVPEPLAPLAPPETPAAETPAAPEVAELTPEPGTIVIAGHGAGPVAEDVAFQLGAPLMAEVSSGARYGRQLIVAVRELLDEPGFGGTVRRAVVFGHPTLTRQVPALLQRDDVEVVAVRMRGVDDYDPGRRARHVDAVRVSGPREAALAETKRWVRASRELVAEEAAAPDLEGSRARDSASRAAFARAEAAVLRRPVDRRFLVEAVWAATWPHDRLVLGASRLIREADRVVPGKKISVHANRGLAGIDGTVATGLGVGLAAQAAGVPGTTRVLLGDLTLLHDAGALALAPGEERPRTQVVVGDDRGGAIFDSLEVAATAPADDFERVLRTPHQVDFAALAAAYGWHHTRAETRGELQQALTAPEPLHLIEVPLTR